MKLLLSSFSFLLFHLSFGQMITIINESAPLAHDGIANFTNPGTITNWWWTDADTNILLTFGNSIDHLTQGDFIFFYDDGSGTQTENFSVFTQLSSCNQMYVSIPETHFLTASNSCDGGFYPVVHGSGDYSFNWSTGATTDSLTGICLGSYTLEVQDILAGCVKTVHLEMNIQPECYEYNFDVFSSQSLGTTATGGAQIINIQNANAPYSVQWDSGNSTSSLSANLTPGIHHVTLTDAGGCTLEKEFGIVQGPCGFGPTSFTITAPTSASTCNGIIETYTPSGISPLTYAWSNGQTTPLLNSVCEDVYSLVVTDAHGCQAFADDFTVGPTNIVECITNFRGYNTSPSDIGQCNGMLALNFEDQSVFSIKVDGANYPTSSAHLIQNLCPGVHMIEYVANVSTQTCRNSHSYRIPQMGDCDSFAVHAIQTAAHNGYTNTGSATIVIDGGQAPFSFDWGNFVHTQTIDHLYPGSYNCYIRDSMGCGTELNIYVQDSSIITAPCTDFLVQILADPISAQGICDGAITSIVTGGTFPYCYEWSSGETESQLQNLCEDQYTLAVSDGNGCVANATAMIFGPCSSFSVSAAVTNAMYPDTCGGSIQLFANNFSGSLNYVWNTGDSTSMIDSLCEGAYWVVVSDSLGCSDTLTSNVQFFGMCDLAGAHDSIFPASSVGGCDGGITLTPQGSSVSLHDVQWSSGDTTLSIYNACCGVYSVSAIDQLGCLITKHLFLNSSPTQGGLFAAAVYTIDAVDNLSCDGQAWIAVSGGQPPYTIHHSNGVTGATAEELCADYYNVTITDNASQQLAIGYVIGDSAIIIQNGNFPDSILQNSCYGNALEMCWVDFGQVSDCYILNWSGNASGDSIAVNWLINSSAGIDTVEMDYYIGQTPSGVIQLSAMIWCPTKNTLHLLKGIDRIYFDRQVLKLTENQANKINLYPNPTSGSLFVHVGFPGSYLISISDNLGREFLSKEIFIQGSTELLELSELASGNYLITVSTLDSTWVKPLIKY